MYPAVNLYPKEVVVTQPIKTCVVTMLFLMGLIPSTAHAQFEHFLVPFKEQKQPGKLGMLYKASEWYLREGTALDAIGTHLVVDHPTVALAADGSVVGRFYGTETGWAGCIVGRRNANGAIAANVLLNFGVSYVSRDLFRRGGKWRYLAVGLNMWRATDSTMAGVDNFRLDAGINDRLRMEAGYNGKIIWSH